MFKSKTKEKQDHRLDFMTEDEIRMVDGFITKIEQNRGYMQDYYDRWEKEQEAYAGDQEIQANRPNSRVNVINANIEGQVAAIVEHNIGIKCRGEGPSDKSFARWGEIGLDWTLRKNHIKQILDRYVRRWELFGAALFKIYWDDDAFNGFGLARLGCPPLNSTFIDMKITDPLYLQDAEYIAEVMPRSRIWAKERFGDRADNIRYGSQDRSPIFTKDKTTDDDDLFWYIQLWTKTDGKLRLIEFSDDGVLLDDSFKEWDGKRFVDKKDPKPFYRYNKYPYFLTILYYEEGKLWGFGDGKLLRPLQDMINDLYDQIRRAARPNRIFFDPESEVELEDIDEDDGPVPCKEPNAHIRVVEVGKVNPALWQLLANIHMEVQRVTRFSELMMGQKTTARTATEAGIQQQQGNMATNHKSKMLEETLVDVCTYALDLMMEKYNEGRAFRIDENAEDYEWIDFRQMNNAPILIPASSAFVEEFKAKNPNAEAPRWMQLKDEQGNAMTKSVDLDVEISIGAGLPKNKAFLWQMLEALSRIVVEGKNVIRWQEFRDFVEEFLGLQLEDVEEAPQQPQNLMPGAMPSFHFMEQGSETEGLSPGGRPMMTALPGGKP